MAEQPGAIRQYVKNVKGEIRGVGNYPPGLREQYAEELATGIDTNYYYYNDGKRNIGERIVKPRLRPIPTFVELVQMEKLERLQQYAGAGMTASQMTAAANNFDNVRKEKALKVLVDQAFTGKVSELVPTIQAGNVDKLRDNNGLYNSVTYLHSIGMSYRDIATELQQREMAELNYQEALERQSNAKAEKNETRLTGDATRAMLAGDDGAFAMAVNEIALTDRSKAADLEKQYAEAGNDRLTSDSKAIDFLDGRGIQLSYADVFSQLLNLSDADKKKYSDIVKTYESDEFTAAKTIIAGQMKISVRIQDMAAEDKNLARHGIFRQIIGELQLRKVMAARNNENFDAIEVGNALVKQMFTEHQAIEFQEDKNSATGYIRMVNGDELKGTGRLLDLTDYLTAQTYFEGVLRSLKDGKAVDRFKPNDIQFVEVYINAMKKAQGQ